MLQKKRASLYISTLDPGDNLYRNAYNYYGDAKNRNGDFLDNRTRYEKIRKKKTPSSCILVYLFCDDIHSTL